MKLIISITFLLLTLTTSAEYRVYQYYVKAVSPYSVDQEPYLVTSSLSPESYLAYHGGRTSIQIDLLRSWKCYGNTSNQETCSPPLLIKNQVDSENKKDNIES